MHRFRLKNNMKKHSFLLLTALAFCAGLALNLNAQEKREWGKWDRWGDLGNGTYLNPF